MDVNVKLIRPILVGSHNHEAGDVVDVPDPRAKLIVERGDGLLVVGDDHQAVPPAIGKPLPTIRQSDAEAPAPAPAAASASTPRPAEGDAPKPKPIAGNEAK